jgi:hypothetical protein
VLSLFALQEVPDGLSEDRPEFEVDVAAAGPLPGTDDGIN